MILHSVQQTLRLPFQTGLKYARETSGIKQRPDLPRAKTGWHILN